MNQENFNTSKNLVIEALECGIWEFDTRNGIGKDDFLVISGGTGSGKSTLSLFMACNIAKSGKRVLYFNTENSMQVMSKKIEFLGFEFDKDFGEPNQKGNPERLIIWNATELTFEQVNNAVLAYKPDVLILDLFSSILEKFQNWEFINKTRDYAKDFSFYPDKYKCAVIVTEQLTKDPSRCKRPTENDIAGGKGLGNKATKIITIYRHAKENMEKLMEDTSQLNISHIVSELVVRKDRHGRIPTKIYPVKLEFGGFKSLMTYELAQYLESLKGK
jgi:predicted ATP-dependent serine protease